MASHEGFRNIAVQQALWNVSWLNTGGASVPASDPAELLLEANKVGGGTATQVYRAAIGFNPTFPGWVTEGSASATRPNVLAVYVSLPAYPVTLMVKSAAAPLTLGMTCDDLNTAWSAATQTPAATTLTIDRRKWYLYYNLSGDIIDNGAFFSIDATAGGSFVYSAALGSIDGGMPALACAHYQFTLRDADGYAGDPVRPDLTALANYLNGLIPADVEIVDCTILHSEADSTAADVDASELVRAGGEISLRASVDPIASWSSSAEPFGTLSLSLPSDLAASNILDTTQYHRLMGTPITFEMDIVRADNTTSLAEMASIRAIAGHSEQSAGAVDVELVSPAGSDLDGKLCRWWPQALIPAPANELDYENETAVRVLFDLLLNCCPSTRWANVLPGDWFHLCARFGGTWGSFDVTAAEAAAEGSVRSLFDKAAATLCLCVGTDISGNVQVWHPAVYRPSIRVHTLDPLEEYASGLKLQGLEGDQYDAVEIPYLIGGVDASEVYQGDCNVRLIGSGRTYSHPLDQAYLDPSGVEWLRLTAMRDGMARQLMQRLVYPAVKLSFSIGLRGLTWRLGDQLIVSSDVLGLTSKAFMVTNLSAAPMAATVEVEAVHYAGWPGGHSTFQGLAPLGVYRWRRAQGWITSVSAYENPTLDNLSWGTDKTHDLTLGGPGSTWGTLAFGSWEGAAMYITETGAVDGYGAQTTAVTYAHTALPTSPTGTQPNQADVQICLLDDAIAFIGNKEYDWLWRWYDTATGAGLALLAHNPYAPNPCTDGSLKFVLAHCSNCNPGIGLWGGANIVASVSTPYGLVLPAAAGAGTPGLVRSFSVSWDAEDVARLFDGQRLIGTLTSTPVPSIVDNFDIRTPQIGTGLYLMNCFTRLSYNATVPGANLMLPDDGLDPFYQ